MISSMHQSSFFTSATFAGASFFGAVFSTNNLRSSSCLRLSSRMKRSLFRSSYSRWADITSYYSTAAFAGAYSSSTSNTYSPIEFIRDRLGIMRVFLSLSLLPSPPYSADSSVGLMSDSPFRASRNLCSDSCRWEWSSSSCFLSAIPIFLSCLKVHWASLF